MLTPRQAQLAFVPLMVTVMSAAISFVMTVLHGGAGPGLLQAWLGNWATAFVVALPVAWVAVPAVRALLSRLTDTAPVAREVGGMG